MATSFSVLSLHPPPPCLKWMLTCVPTEFDFRSDGSARYANNSNYRNDSLIRKESTARRHALVADICWRVVCVSPAVIAELKRIVKDSEIMKYCSIFPSMINLVEKKTINGRQRTKMVVKSWKFVWATYISRLRYWTLSLLNLRLWDEVWDGD